MTDWSDDYAQVMADMLIGFDSNRGDPFGPYDDPAARDEDGNLHWPQKLAWEIRECAVSATETAIRRAAGLGPRRRDAGC